MWRCLDLKMNEEKEFLIIDTFKGEDNISVEINMKKKNLILAIVNIYDLMKELLPNQEYKRFYKIKYRIDLETKLNENSEEETIISFEPTLQKKHLPIMIDCLVAYFEEMNKQAKAKIISARSKKNG